MVKQKSLVFLLIPVLLFFSCMKNKDDPDTGSEILIKDSMNREVRVTGPVEYLICSGAGALRYITYMQCEQKVVAVDDMEKERPQFDARPYAFAHPEFKELPMFGEFRGLDNPELIITLNPRPDIIFKTYGAMGYSPDELQQKTTIPVCVFEYGDLGRNKPAFYATLDLIGKIMHKEERAESIQEYIDTLISDLNQRTRDSKNRKTCFLGGVAYRGPHGLQSTEPGYPPFLFLNTKNAAAGPETTDLAHMDVSKEKIVEWDPDVIFIDLATMQSDPQANALHELITDPAYTSLKAVATGDVYGVLPYNWYTQNHGSTLANAYYIGKVLYPEKFADIDPAEKADEIYEFLVGTPVFKMMDESFQHTVYKRLEL